MTLKTVISMKQAIKDLDFHQWERLFYHLGFHCLVAYLIGIFLSDMWGFVMIKYAIPVTQAADAVSGLFIGMIIFCYMFKTFVHELAIIMFCEPDVTTTCKGCGITIFQPIQEFCKDCDNDD